MLTLQREVELAPFTSMGVGGPAEYFARIDSVGELREALQRASDLKLNVTILGGGSNIVVADRGLRGLVLQLNLRGISERVSGDRVLVCAASGEEWDELVRCSVERSLAGLECLSGIPGRVGATPIQNVGAYGQEVSDSIDCVHTLDRQTGELKDFSGTECDFAYRSSRFKMAEPGRYVVLSVDYLLTPGAPPSIRYADLQARLPTDKDPTVTDVRRVVLETRRSKSMVLDASDPNGRSCGSFFVNPIVDAGKVDEITRLASSEPPHHRQPDGRYKVPAAWLIERAGLGRGHQQGAVGLSTRHTLAIVCHAGASALDVIRFAKMVRQRVDDRFGVRLIVEPEFLGFPKLVDRLPELSANPS